MGDLKFFMSCARARRKARAVPAVNNFAAHRAATGYRIGLGVSFPLSVLRFSRPSGPGLLTTSRVNDFELMDRPAGRDLTLERLLRGRPLTTARLFYIGVAGSSLRERKDAEYLADLLLNHHAQLPVWSPEDSARRRVQQLVFHRRAVVEERTALSNRLIALLKQYFPQALTLCGKDLWRPLASVRIAN